MRPPQQVSGVVVEELLHVCRSVETSGTRLCGELLASRPVTGSWRESTERATTHGMRRTRRPATRLRSPDSLSGGDVDAMAEGVATVAAACRHARGRSSPCDAPEGRRPDYAPPIRGRVETSPPCLSAHRLLPGCRSRNLHLFSPIVVIAGAHGVRVLTISCQSLL